MSTERRRKHPSPVTRRASQWRLNWRNEACNSASDEGISIRHTD
jgi:hypothetical protein